MYIINNYFFYIYKINGYQYISKYLKESENSASKIFRINYSNHEQNIIDNIDIKRDIENDYKFCGEYIKILPDIEEFLEKVTNNTKNENIDLTKILNRLVSKLVKGYNRKYIWVSLRVTYSNNYFETPRWHIDGNYHPADYKLSKFVTVLKGAGTLLKKSNDESKKIYFDTEKEFIEEVRGKSREEYKKIQVDYQKIHDERLKNIPTMQLKNNEGLIFFSGYDNKNSQIHSEPDMKEPRMFLSIFAMDNSGYEHMKNKSQCKNMEGGSKNYHNKFMKYSLKLNNLQ